MTIMHSPIIYIVENEKGLFKEMNYELDEDLVPCEEYLDERLEDSDWHEPNTIKRKNWHRGEWPIFELFDRSRYINAQETNDTIKLQNNYENIKARNEDLIKEQEKDDVKTRQKIYNNKRVY